METPHLDSSFRTVIETILNDFRTALDSVRQSEVGVEEVHQLRIAARKLEAALTLFAPMLQSSSRGRWLRLTRRLRRKSNAIRDLDVLLEWWRKNAKDKREPKG